MSSTVANPAHLRRALNAVAVHQAGYFTAAQACKVGYSHQSHHYHVQRGNWNRVARGVYRLPEWPVSENDLYVLWLLWSGGRATVSHESALAVHDLGDVNPARVHLTVPPDFHAKNPVVVLHRAVLPPGDVEEHTAFRVTTVVRTLLDVAAGDLSQEQLDTAIADSLDRGLTSSRRLRSRVDDHGDRAALRIERALQTADS